MQASEFAVNVVSSLDHPLITANTYVVVSAQPVRVLGFTIDPFFAVLSLTVTIASADGSTIYHVFQTDGTTATQIVNFTPFLADKGLAWKSNFAVAPQFSGLISTTFFLMNPGM